VVEFSQEIFDEICDRIVDGESLRSICRDEKMPSRKTFFQWVNNNETLGNQYARAKSDQQDTYVEQIIEIADTEPDPNKARVRIDARKWHAGKLAAKKYGDKIGIDGDVKLTLTNSVLDLIDGSTRSK
jgi:hypothetical protein